MTSATSLPGRASGSSSVRLRLILLAAVLLCSISMSASAATLSGRVLDPDGRPVAGATIAVAGGSASPLVATADPEGRFSVDLVPGRYDLFVSSPGLAGEARQIRVESAGTTLDLALRVAAVHETMVVSASQVDQPLSQIPDSVTVITGDDLKARQIWTLGAALRSVPGFAVAQTGGPGTLTSLFPRGGESDYTLVLVDGVRANAFGGGLDLSQVPLENVERIEIVRGPQSALYGSDAIGGVVQVITRRGGPPSADGRVEFGSRHARRIVGAARADAGAWRVHASGDYYDDDGFTGAAPANGEPVTNDDAQEGQARAGIGWRDRSRGTDLQAIAGYVETERGAPGAFGSDPAGRFTGVDRIARGTTARRTAALRVVHPWFGASSRIRQRVELDTADYDLGFSTAFGRSDSETRRTHARVQTDAVLSTDFGMSAGVEWIAERGSSTFITADDATLPLERRMIGAFGEVRWNGLPRLSVTAGLRAEQIRRGALPLTPPLAEDTVMSVSPKIAGAWLLTSRTPGEGTERWTRLRGSVSTGIRPPDVFEIAFTDNPGLKPERSRSAELGITQAFAGGALQVEGTAFLNQYDDLIIAVGRFSTASPFRTDNISNARSRGLELSGAWRTPAGFDVRAAYTLLDTEVRAVDGAEGEAPPPYRVGDPLLRRPRHQGSLDGRWTRSGITAYGELLVRGRTLDAEPAFGPTGGLFTNDGYAIANLGASVRIARGVEVYSRVLNLFDRRYEEVLGFPAPGRLAFIGVRLAASR